MYHGPTDIPVSFVLVAIGSEFDSPLKLEVDASGSFSSR